MLPAEYAPAAMDIRDQANFGEFVSPRWGFSFNPFLVANSGVSFDVTAGQGLYGTTIFNGTPGVALIVTKTHFTAGGYEHDL